MKFLIAFALFAVAFADVEPFRLRKAPAPAIEGSNDYPKFVEVVQSPTPIAAQETSAVSNIANIVKVVDFVKGELNTIGGVKATFEEAEPSYPSYNPTVKFVDEALNEEHEDNDSTLVKVVESPLEAAAPSDLTVTVVNEAVNYINVNKGPLDKMVESPLEEAPSDIAVNFVDEAVNSIDDESVYNESPLEEAGPVNFVYEAVNKVVSDAEIAPSFDSYAGISKLIKAAQEENDVEGSSTVVVTPIVLYVPTAVNVVETAVNMGHILSVGIEDTYEDSVDVRTKADDSNFANGVRVVDFPRGKVFNNPMLR